MTPHSFTFLTTSALVALALATGTAQAMTADVDGTTTTATSTKVIPNDRGGRLGVGSVESAAIPDVFERAAQRAIDSTIHLRRSTVTVPYLSQGLGVDASAFAGAQAATEASPLPIPYLSHGQGVDLSAFGGVQATSDVSLPPVPYLSQGAGVSESTWNGVTRPDDRGGARGPGALSSPTLSPTDDGLDWRTIGFGGGAFILVLGAIALGAVMLGGHRRTPAH